jgi:hypothetical protein
MTKTLVLFLSLTTISLLTACAGKQAQLASSEPQYCYTDETIQVENGQTVNSKTTLDCTDKPRVEHFVKDTGIAKNCRPYQQTVSIKGRYKNVQGFLCQFADGSWQAVDGSYAY